MGLLARYLEDHGLATVTLSNNRTRTSLVRPPRTLTVPGPRGQTAGPPGDRPAQRARVAAALRLLVEAREPGTAVVHADPEGSRG